MAAETVTFSGLKKALATRKYAPIYLLHGEEGYYIDELVKDFECILDESERDFNQFTFYAPQVEPSTIIEACHQYPMMSDHQVVIVKELHSVTGKYLEKLVPYCEQPSPQTILIFVSRGPLPKCAEFSRAIIKAGGVVFESKKLRDNQIGPVIRDLITEKGLNVEPKALSMLQDFVGLDLSRIYNEVGKLSVILPPGGMITPEVVERNIGVSKDFNNFELVAAIARRDSALSYRIVDYFKSNPKNNPTVVTTSVLFNFFANMLIAYYAPDKSERGLMNELGFKSSFQLRDINIGLRAYNPWQVIEILDAIRRFDANSKGVGSRQDAYDLLLQLVFTILNCRGEIKV